MKKSMLIFAVFVSLAFSKALLGATILVGPYLQYPTQTSITIMWETDQACSSEILYGEKTPLDKKITVEQISRIHEVKLSGLKPETIYYYRVISDCGAYGKVKSKLYSFKTAVKKDSAFAFVVMGDNRTLTYRFHRISQLTYAERPDFVLNVGDVCTNGLKKFEWKLEFFDPAKELMANVPTYIAIGNHERDAFWYYYYVSYPEPENYYSFDYGNAHFAIIDSNKDLSPGSEQYQWLEQDLAKSQATWKFVAHHHPPYSSDLNDYGDTKRGKPSTYGDLNVRNLVPLYEKYGVDIVFYGHIHSYERTWPLRAGKIDPKNGVIYLQVGGAGAELENFAPQRSWFTAKVAKKCHYVLFNIYQKSLTMMSYDSKGRLFDYLELNKE